MNSAHGAPAPGYLSSPIASPAPSTTSSISQLHYSTAAWPAKVISFKFGKESRRHCLVVAVEPQSLKLSPHCRHPFSPAAGDELHHQEPLDLEVHHWRMRKGPLEPLHHSPPASEPSIAAGEGKLLSQARYWSPPGASTAIVEMNKALALATTSSFAPATPELSSLLANALSGGC
ncbi:uncharacterized protein LOC106866614 isoform X2 [Brachypodium distachyon]|uniref:uncharacterized protein LOC106866614 isoform X2 n=1 Tax=Brachypodium distachyon TaxID=15368 RepID=UPI000D0CB29E|nr:uncharacterized protein LOC106866614 isoform X2 [Brachypodium distachyon]|eukprot:XP_024319255.1 uncharacterized protein LOC106866614 isoform X2 [Brachypodium distachyon]